MKIAMGVFNSPLETAANLITQEPSQHTPPLPMNSKLLRAQLY
jgi:hypothetical protein